VQQLHSHAELCHPSACRQTDKRQTTHQAPEACPSYSFHATCMHTHTVHMYAGIQYTCTHKNTPPNERAVWEPWGSCVVCNGAMAECLRTAHHLEFINLAVVCNDPTMHAMHACAHVQAPTTFKTEYSPPCYLAMYRYVSYMYLARSIQVCPFLVLGLVCACCHHKTLRRVPAMFPTGGTFMFFTRGVPWLPQTFIATNFYLSDVGGVVLG
jgi:hypothetical protein